MARYLDAFFRHRLVMVAPIILAIAAAAVYAMAQPLTYQTTETVWFSPTQQTDTTGTATVILPDTSTATKAVAVFQEFLKTRSFDLQVGRDGKLADYYASNPPSGTGLTGLAHRLAEKVGLASKDTTLSGGALDDQVATAVGADIAVAATGPQLVDVTVTGPSPESAAGMAAAVYKAFDSQVVATRGAALQNEVDYYKGAVKSAADGMAAADSTLQKYATEHPAPRGELVATTDATGTSLLAQSTAAHALYQTTLGQLTQSQSALNSVTQNPGYHVIDPAQTPGGSVSRTRKVLLSTVGGLFVGVLLMLSLVVVIAAADRTLRSPADVERALAVRAGGTIPRLRKLPASGAR